VRFAGVSFPAGRAGPPVKVASFIAFLRRNVNGPVGQPGDWSAIQLPNCPVARLTS